MVCILVAKVMRCVVKTVEHRAKTAVHGIRYFDS